MAFGASTLMRGCNDGVQCWNEHGVWNISVRCLDHLSVHRSDELQCRTPERSWIFFEDFNLWLLPHCDSEIGHDGSYCW